MSLFVFHDSKFIFHSYIENNYKVIPIDDSVNKSTLLKDYKNTIRIYNNSTRVTIVPNAIFSPSQAKDHFELNFGGITLNERLYFTINSSFDISIVFAIQKEIDEFRNSFQSTLIIEHFSQLVLNFLKFSIPSNEPFIVVTPLSIYFSMKNENKLIQLNTSDFETETDIVYFTLANLKSLEISKINELFICVLKETDNFNLIELQAVMNQIDFFNQTAIVPIDPVQFFVLK